MVSQWQAHVRVADRLTSSMVLAAEHVDDHANHAWRIVREVIGIALEILEMLAAGLVLASLLAGVADLVWLRIAPLVQRIIALISEFQNLLARFAETIRTIGAIAGEAGETAGKLLGRGIVSLIENAPANARGFTGFYVAEAVPKLMSGRPVDWRTNAWETAAFVGLDIGHNLVEEALEATRAGARFKAAVEGKADVPMSTDGAVSVHPEGDALALPGGPVGTSSRLADPAEQGSRSASRLPGTGSRPASPATESEAAREEPIPRPTPEEVERILDPPRLDDPQPVSAAETGPEVSFAVPGKEAPHTEEPAAESPLPVSESPTSPPESAAEAPKDIRTSPATEPHANTPNTRPVIREEEPLGSPGTPLADKPQIPVADAPPLPADATVAETPGGSPRGEVPPARHEITGRPLGTDHPARSADLADQAGLPHATATSPAESLTAQAEPAVDHDIPAPNVRDETPPRQAPAEEPPDQQAVAAEVLHPVGVTPSARTGQASAEHIATETGAQIPRTVRLPAPESAPEKAPLPDTTGTAPQPASTATPPPRVDAPPEETYLPRESDEVSAPSLPAKEAAVPHAEPIERPLPSPFPREIRTEIPYTPENPASIVREPSPLASGPHAKETAESAEPLSRELAQDDEVISPSHHSDVSHRASPAPEPVPSEPPFAGLGPTSSRGSAAESPSDATDSESIASPYRPFEPKRARESLYAGVKEGINIAVGNMELDGIVAHVTGNKTSGSGYALELLGGFLGAARQGLFHYLPVGERFGYRNQLEGSPTLLRYYASTPISWAYYGMYLADKEAIMNAIRGGTTKTELD
ncbi:hypothetical protein SAMN05216267_105024 [Actinacidiphila rubida]|uniref:Uncharacterized protein n=2 Tax=Actinacidiphila rubida TaxID=310780 RepID=A0A1H8TB29_9ACTN|nr:hypothetical protein SAMN05216267_105024 [Actinacidiphila rubida]